MPLSTTYASQLCMAHVQTPECLSAQRSKQMSCATGFHFCHCLHDLMPATSSSQRRASHSSREPLIPQGCFPASSCLGLSVCPPNSMASSLAFNNCYPAWKLLVLSTVFKLDRDPQMAGPASVLSTAVPPHFQKQTLSISEMGTFSFSRIEFAKGVGKTIPDKGD